MIIENDVQLEAFLENEPKRSITVRLQYFSDIENKKIETTLNALINECGCQFGSYFLAMGIIIFVFALLYLSLSLKYILFSLCGLLLFSVVGKFIGITIAKKKLILEANKIIIIAQQRMCAHAAELPTH